MMKHFYTSFEEYAHIAFAGLSTRIFGTGEGASD